MKKRMTFLILKNEFSQIRVCFSIRALRRTSALNNDFSRRHLCQNPPALAGGRLSDYGKEIINSYETIFNYLFVGLHYYSIFRIKEIMEEYFDMELNIFLLFFFHIFYIQYKINQNQQTHSNSFA